MSGKRKPSPELLTSDALRRDNQSRSSGNHDVISGATLLHRRQTEERAILSSDDALFCLDSTLDLDNVNSPGGCSTTSSSEEPVYVRTPGFEHHAQEFVLGRRLDAPGVERRFVKTVTTGTATKKKKKTVLFSAGEGVKGEEGISAVFIHGSNVKTKLRRDPVPMKFRALPQSFWQQPNHTNCLSPGAVYPVLPPLGNLDKDEEVSGRNSCTNTATQEDTPPSRPDMVSAANTDLLFSLFRGVEEDMRRGQGQTNVNVVRRGRPKKHPTHLLTRVLRDDDPYLISAVTESMLPLIPDRAVSGSGRNYQGQQVLAMVSLREGDKTVSLPSLSVEHNNYSHILSELVIKL